MVSKSKIVIGFCILLTGMAITIGVLTYLIIDAQKDTNEVDDTGCEIYPFEVDPHPLIILSGSSNFIYPKPGEKTLKFKKGEAVDLICPGRKLLLGSTATNDSTLTGTCLRGGIFRIGNQEVDWRTVICNNSPWRDIRTTGRTCENNGEELEAGFNVDDGRFIRSLLICFNKDLQIAYWTFINQTASINQRVLDTPRPSWLQGSGIYTTINTSVTNLYNRNNQRATINSLLGLPANSTKYIQDNTNRFLSRGHITARSDGFYAAQQNVTFFMQNIAPQFQTFNGFNWNKIEIDVRDYAEANLVDLQVWSGVHGVTTLPHEETNEETELYLYVNSETGMKALPVPEVYWKVVYDPITEKGVALIGVNNPYKDTYTPLCFEVTNQIQWLHCDRNNKESGFCYACSVDTLRYVVTSIPNIPVRGLLL